MRSSYDTVRLWSPLGERVPSLKLTPKIQLLQVSPGVLLDPQTGKMHTNLPLPHEPSESVQSAVKIEGVASLIREAMLAAGI